jgi:hypothetical protein
MHTSRTNFSDRVYRFSNTKLVDANGRYRLLLGALSTENARLVQIISEVVSQDDILFMFETLADDLKLFEALGVVRHMNLTDDTKKEIAELVRELESGTASSEHDCGLLELMLMILTDTFSNDNWYRLYNLVDVVLLENPWDMLDDFLITVKKYPTILPRLLSVIAHSCMDYNEVPIEILVPRLRRLFNALDAPLGLDERRSVLHGLTRLQSADAIDLIYTRHPDETQTIIEALVCCEQINFDLMLRYLKYWPMSRRDGFLGSPDFLPTILESFSTRDTMMSFVAVVMSDCQADDVAEIVPYLWKYTQLHRAVNVSNPNTPPPMTESDTKCVTFLREAIKRGIVCLADILCAANNVLQDDESGGRGGRNRTFDV